MSESSPPLAFAGLFPAASREQWQRLVEGVLKGRPFETLISKTYDGLSIEPLYARVANAQPLAGRAPAAPWQIMQRIDLPEPAAANAEALHELENGATGLTLVFSSAIGAYGFGVDAAVDAVSRVLEDVHLDAGVALELDPPADAGAAAQALAEAVQRRGDPASADIRFGLDPLGAMAMRGSVDRPWRELATGFSTTIGRLTADGFKGPFAAADGRVVHAAGGSEAQELAFSLASAVAYLRALEAAGVALDTARRMIFFRLAADADQLLTIAKFRAVRKLWARVEEGCGLSPRPAFVVAETAWRMMTRRDPHVNMLRATVATFSAAVGGADAIAVLPFTAALGLPDRFARRIARNTQLILAEESNLAKVADPAAGAGAIEDLTDQLCRAAWTSFQETEAAGGLAAALAAGLVQRQVAGVRAARERAIACGRDPLTGTSAFPNLAEGPVAVLAPHPPPLAGEAASEREPEGAYTRDSADGKAPHPNPLPASGERGTTEFPALMPLRLAKPLEALRDSSDAILARTGARPKVFLANLGRPSDFLARAAFAQNFFASGGIEAVTNDGFPPSPPPPEKGRSAGAAGRVGVSGNADPSPALRADPPLSGEGRTDLAALAAAFQASGATLACICSSDEIYAREAVVAARTLSAAGAGHIYLAGRVRDLEQALRQAGVQSFVYAGCDALAALAAAHDIFAESGGQANSRGAEQAQ